MGIERVTVLAGGGEFTGFERVMVRASFQDAARTFELKIAAEQGGAVTAWRFKAGTELKIAFNGDIVLAGYVDRYQPRLGNHSQAEISIAGRSKSQDFIDSSAVHDRGQWKNKTPLEIARELDRFGVGISSNEQLEKIPVYRLTPGETCFRVLEKQCREQSVWPVGVADGSIRIMKAGQGRHTAIEEGRNLLVGEADHNWSGRHSEVIVRGQRPFGHGADALEIEARARDNSVGRYRPVIVFKDSDTDNKRAKKRAAHRRDSEAGNSLKANVTCQGFRDDAGKVWEPGHLLYLGSPFLDIQQDMAIESVTWEQARDSGSLSVLSLVDPRALGGKGRSGGSANGAWGSGAGED